jgi:hypothetical protein
VKVCAYAARGMFSRFSTWSKQSSMVASWLRMAVVSIEFCHTHLIALGDI